MPAELPTDVMTRRVIRTGLTEATGHEVEFDDALQSITITTSTEQKITLDPEKIEVSTTSGSVKITLDLSTQSVAIEAPNEIKLKALKSIKLEAAKIDIQGTDTTTIKGGMVNIN